MKTHRQLQECFAYGLFALAILVASAGCVPDDGPIREDCYCTAEIVHESEPCRTVCGAVSTKSIRYDEGR